MKYILKNEGLSLRDLKIGSTTNYDTLRKILKDGGKIIFIGKLDKDLNTLNTKLPLVFPTHPRTKISTIAHIKDELIATSSKNLEKEDKDFLNNVLIQIKNLDSSEGKFTQIVELCDRGSSLYYRDFYTGKEIPSTDTISSDEQTYKYYNGVRKLYKLYEKYYNSYGIKNLPLSSDSKIEQKKIGLNILKGIGSYCSIVRGFLDDSIKRVQSNEVLVRERNRVNRLKKEKEERNQMGKQNKQERQERQEKNQRNKQNKQETKPVNKNALLKKKIERINKEISEAKSNEVKKKLEELKLKIMKS